MCPAHRSEVIAEVRSLLAGEKPCRVVSTQLVEAGVDVDFPVVFRALCGLDSIVQAAGRCNREGRLRRGDVFVFRAPTKPPPGVLRAGLEATEALLRESEGELDPEDPATMERYFRYLYFTQPLDNAGIQMEREHFNFVETGRKFQVIEDEFTATIVVPYGDSEARLQEVRAHGATRDDLRALQRFSISVYPDTLARLEAAGAIEEIVPGVYALSAPYRHLYDEKFGLVVGDEVRPDPTMLVI
jgi:CRISPR-associated endonuclease/helicase Cas3